MCKISIIIPIYNAENYLERTFRCLLSQTEQRFEAILINDGSYDRSGELCAEMASRDTRFRYFPQANSGVSAARNYGMKLAQGEYITFLDADDEITPEYLEALLSCAESSGCPMAVCDVAVITDGTETVRFSCGDGVFTGEQILTFLLTRQKVNSGPYAKLFRRELLEKAAFPPLKAYEDILFVVEAASRCGRVAATSQTAYRYIQNTTGAMGQMLRAPSTDIIKATGWLLEFIQRHPDLDPSCFYITVSHLMQYVQPMADQDTENARAFILAARRLMAQYRKQIQTSSSFTRKEKVVYQMLIFGWLFYKKRLYRLR